MAYPKKEKLSTESAIVIVGAALALFVGVFLFFSSWYDEDQNTQVTQNSTDLGPGNELPIAPLTPPAAPPASTPSDPQSPVTQ